MTLNGPDDENCVACGRSLGRADLIARVEKDEQIRSTPGWVYFFATLCGAIPIVALGGIIPIGIGLGGASACLAVGRANSLPGVIRLMACIGVTICCWILFAVSMAALAKAFRRH
jgi:hypothetical protein